MALRSNERAAIRAYWRQQFVFWTESGLTQWDFCKKHGISYKNFGNWRSQLKREDAVGADARWGRYPPLRSRSGSQPGPTAVAGAEVVAVAPKPAAGETPPHTPRTRAAPTARPSQPASIFIECAAVGVEIELSDGTRIRFDRRMKPDTIRRVVRALEGHDSND